MEILIRLDEKGFQCSYGDTTVAILIQWPFNVTMIIDDMLVPLAFQAVCTLLYFLHWRIVIQLLNIYIGF
jgi:hypothetical protein